MDLDEKYTRSNDEVVQLVDEVSKVLRGIFLQTQKPTSVSDIADEET
jgi:hypothetical protein